MKYFNNITTADELKKQFRAYCVTIHPDKGGDAEEFKEMVDEYNRINANFDQAKAQQAEEEEARRQEEEWRKEEEERKRKEEEEARKAAEALREVIAEWSGKLKSVAGLDDGQRYGHSTAYYAAVKHNIKVIFNTYFPGVTVKISFKNSGWCTGADIIWFDGPSVDEVKNTLEFKYFVGWYHVCSPYEDYGHDERYREHEAWIKEYGEIGRSHGFGYDRRFTDLAKNEIRAKIVDLFPQFENVSEKGAAIIGGLEALKIGDYLHLDINDYNMCNDYRDIANSACDGKDISYKDLFDLFRQHYTTSEETAKANKAAAEAPVFTPKHNKTYQAIKKALGSNVFGIALDGFHYQEVSIKEAAEYVAQGVKVWLVKPSTFDGEVRYYGVNLGGAKVQRKRAEKFAAVDVTITCTLYNSYQDVEVLQFSTQVLADLRKDAEDIEAQRKAWEEAQKTGKASRKSTRTANTDNTDKTEAADHATATDAAEDTAAPAEGLELVEIPGGVAVVGDRRTTFRNRKHIKAHGATWNKEAQQWQATDPKKVAQLRAWFGVEDATDATATETSTTAQDVAQAANEPQADANTDNATETDTTAQADPIATESVATLAAALESICEALTDAAAAAQAEAAKTAEQARKHTEAEQLRQDIANISAQVAQMSDTLNKMLARLAALEADTDNATATDPHTETNIDQTADTDTNAQPSPAPGDGGKADNTDDSSKTDGTPNSGKAGKDGGDFVTLDLLRSACEDADQHTQDGDHIGAVLARLYALCACAVDVRDLIEQAQALNRLRQARGVSSPEEYEQAQQIAAEGRKRAEKVLVPCAFATLYGEGTPGNQAAA